MKIVVDTNVICQDYRFTGTSFRLFFDGLKLIHGQLVFPEVVIDEVVNRFQEELKSVADDLTQVERKFGRYVDDRRSKVHLVVDVIYEAEKYKAKLLTDIKVNEGIILPYPNIEHKSVVERDLKRMKPFKFDGSGYRDMLIWESIKNILLNDNDSVVFISSNKKDFGEGPLIDKIFHPELPDPEKLIICSSLKDFIEKYISPKLKVLGNIKDVLLNNDLGKFDLSTWINSNILGLIKDYYDLRMIVTKNNKIKSVQPYAIKKIDSTIDIPWIKEMQSGEIFISFPVKLELEYEVHVDDDNIKEKHLHLVNNSSTKTISMGNVSSELLVIVSLIIDRNNSTVKTANLGPIDGTFGTIDIDGTFLSHEF